MQDVAGAAADTASSDGEDDEDGQSVGMVPFADILNAKAGANNVRSLSTVCSELTASRPDCSTSPTDWKCALRRPSPRENRSSGSRADCRYLV
jgi:hypothetical protein